MRLEKELFDKWFYDFLKECESKYHVTIRIRELGDSEKIGKINLNDYLSIKFYKTTTPIAEIESYFDDQMKKNRCGYLYIYSTSYDCYEEWYIIIYALIPEPIEIKTKQWSEIVKPELHGIDLSGKNIKTFCEKIEDKDIDKYLYECDLLFCFMPNSSPKDAITHIKLNDVIHWERKITYEYSNGELEVEYVIRAKETMK